ncbi:hypothetical protein NEF87_003075 [Candidatus Lokiarchaeum ossiferum]|uniref:Glycosyl transferase n=1 Tax=Candidatus Lokiarchaeum ossiferum TaxID=2951803 RepID=A0ABY6HTN7_9ARCH|nr:hypothetical protein NEF87_003075 [Candidatus Lokiarchaeum sp. B-35]
MDTRIATRNLKNSPESQAQNIFSSIIKENSQIDAIFTDSRFNHVFAAINIPKKAPIVIEILKSEIFTYFFDPNCSLLFKYSDRGRDVSLYQFKLGKTTHLALNTPQKQILLTIYNKVSSWGGKLTTKGELVVDLLSPLPGPHYYTNLLIGNRIGFDFPLQSTPKGVVDRLGRGSFRSHAATQVLATRWDMLPEENGFPANRQFYLLENGKQIFFSANPSDDNILEAKCVHSQNYTTISYSTKCGIKILRKICILPQEKGMPLATELQQIYIENNSDSNRDLKLIYVGMFGSATPHAMKEDVIYSNIIMQSQLVRNEDGSIKAVGWDYYPEFCREDLLFHSSIAHIDKQVIYPTEFCFNYNDFVGNGNLSHPQNIYPLNNKMQRKGPGFFAVASNLLVSAKSSVYIDNFTGIVSSKLNPKFDDLQTYEKEISSLIHKYSQNGASNSVLSSIIQFQEKFSEYLQVESEDKYFQSYFNKNLPFQIAYQTFVSRSFAQTQKGYREIGFREIQDLFASMYYFSAMGQSEFVKTLIKIWASKVFEFGFAYHNFFWNGKEPGKWSDDALWLLQAIDRYIKLTGDNSILDEKCAIAGTNPKKSRSIYETIQAIIQFSAEISVGQHGLPLLDKADWNDCLQLEGNPIDGPTKEKLYKKQIRGNPTLIEPLENNFAESVMNACLLQIALDISIRFAESRQDDKILQKWTNLSTKLKHNIQTHGWKNDFYARVLFNQDSTHNYSYLGAQKDGISADPHIDGSYFLNSFSWAVMANIASEDQIDIMLDRIEKYLKSPFGIKLVTPTNLEKIHKGTATGHYFPGDRENGGVFKHASMMFTASLFKAANNVEKEELARKMCRLAYWMIDLVLPYYTIENPFEICGNPRFCTQYNNSQTGENIGPILSGTATWLNISLISAFGINYSKDKLQLNPILREQEEYFHFTLNTGSTILNVNISKPKGFYRMKNAQVEIKLNGKIQKGTIFPSLHDHQEHLIEIIYL